MSDKAEWKGGRIGPYEIGKRYPGITEDEGRLYEARHVGTGEPALAVMPGTEEEWRTSQPWDVRTTHSTRPEALLIHPRRRPGQRAPGLHELALGYIRAAAALSLLDARDDAQDLFSRGSTPPRSRSPALRWGLACASVALSLVLVFLLWPRQPESADMAVLRGEPFMLVAGLEPALNTISYPMPQVPFNQQRRPPCAEETEVEVRKGCWILHTKSAP